MTFTVSALARFFQCGERYRLQDIECIPDPPNTRQVIGRVVREAVQGELTHKMRAGALLERQAALQAIESIVRYQMSFSVALTEQESSQGQRRTFETVWRTAVQLVMMWRAVVAPRIHPTHVKRPFSVQIAGHTIEGFIEIQEAQSIRTTKVRNRRPEAGDADYDMHLTAWALAVEKMDGTLPHEGIINYLIDAKEMGVDRQTCRTDRAQIVALEQRVDLSARSIESGVFVPSDALDWRCRACPHRPICRYV